jgi:hypothetical protein
VHDSGSNDLLFRVAYTLGSSVQRVIWFFGFPYRSIAGAKEGRIPFFKTKEPISDETQRKGIPPKEAQPSETRSGRTNHERMRTPHFDDGEPFPVDSGAAQFAMQSGMPALAEALSSPNPKIRKLAIDTIGEFSAEEASQLIIEVLPDPDPGVRCAAIAAAVRAKAPATVFSLILMLDDISVEVRSAAKRAIEALSGEKIAFDPEDESADLKEKIEELKRWWKERRLAQLASEL